MITKLLSASLFLTVFFLSLWSTGCTRDNSLVIEKGSPLRFVVSGRGAVNHFRISGPDLEREPNPRGNGERLMLLKDYWEVAPVRTATSRSLDEIRVIKYGEVPDGFVQVLPINGAPPPLVEGNLYCASLVANGGRGFTTFFSVRDGKIVAEGQK